MRTLPAVSSLGRRRRARPIRLAQQLHAHRSRSGSGTGSRSSSSSSSSARPPWHRLHRRQLAGCRGGGSHGWHRDDLQRRDAQDSFGPGQRCCARDGVKDSAYGRGRWRSGDGAGVADGGRSRRLLRRTVMKRNGVWFIVRVVIVGGVASYGLLGQHMEQRIVDARKLSTPLVLEPNTGWGFQPVYNQCFHSSPGNTASDLLT